MLKSFLGRLLWCAWLMAGLAALAAPHKLRVTDPTVAKSLIAQGGRLIGDYDTFQLIEVEDAPMAAATESAEPADDLNVIELNARPLDTRKAEVQALRASAGGFGGRRLRLVHFAGPIKTEWRTALEQHGAQIVSYVPQNAYLIYGDASALGRVQAWAQTKDYVQWDGDYADDYKIHPRARLRDKDGNPQDPGTDVFAIQLMDDADAAPSTLAVIDRLRLAPIKRQFRTLQYQNVIVRLAPQQLDQIAAQPDVVSIQPYFENHKLDERQDQILAGNLTGVSPNGPGYLAWLGSKGFSQSQFTASGFVVDVTDSGLDNGSTAPGHFGLYESGDPALTSRVAYARLEGTANPGSTTQACDGHGNLNSHIVAGFNDLPAGFPHTDSSGFHYGLGVCPFVRVGSSVIFDPNTFTGPNFPNLQSEAYQDGARVSANSWGADVSGMYTVDSQAYDALVRDAQPTGSTFATASNQQMVIVFAAGNAGPGAQTIDSPGSAKNVITVGASENVRSLSTANGGVNAAGDSRCTSDSDVAANNANDMADFSSRGPCADGRKKPDLVAPGTHITGGVGQSGSPTTNGNGSAIACFNASGVCGLPGAGTVGNPNNFFPLGQQFYTVSTGTSHSTPAVAGACALIRQYFINNGLLPPSPAMTKAFLMNSARYLNGSGANDTLWSANQGMGELNLGTAFDAQPRIVHDQEFTNKFTATGQTRTFSGAIADSSKPFRVTLAWSDAPGSTVGNAFNNDLDLSVTVSGTTYKGNVFSGQFSTNGGTADNKNNVESVFLPAGLLATFTVTVSAANINSDGVPNEAPSLDQDFALVIYNAAEGPVPLIKADTFGLSAETCSPANGGVDPGEPVTVDFALKNTGFADTTNLVATLLATNGVASPSGPQSYGAISAGGGIVTQSFSFTAVGICGGTINPVLQLQDGSAVLGAVTFSVPLGQSATMFSQNFDSVTNPALPAGWTSTTSGGQTVWTTTSTGVKDTAPNTALSAEASSVGFNVLLSPAIALPVGQSQLNFRNNYNLEAPASGTTGYDGGVLEIKIGGGLFTDIISAGGSFVAGGYNRTISSSFANPLAGRQAWSGNSGGFITTTVILPPSASGQTIQLRWRCGTDNSVGGSGWRVDTITLTGYTCCSTSTAELVIAETPAFSVVNLTSNLTSVIVVSNLGPGIAGGVVVTSTVPAGLSVVSTISSQGTVTNFGNVVSSALGTISNGATATVTIHSTAITAGTWTNVATASSLAVDPVPGNNTVQATIFVNSFPTISSISPQATAEDTSTDPIAFTIGDAETSAAFLALSAASSDTNLVAVTNIVFGGSASNRSVTITPAPDGSGACTITLFVSDGFATASSSFSFTVDPVNDPPILAPIPNFIITEGDAFVFTNSASDIEAPPELLTFSMTNAPAGASLDPTNGVFTWMPAENQGPDVFVITVVVTDNGVPPARDEKSFSITVLESNQAPVLAAIKDRTIHVGSQLIITNSATDPDLPANALSYGFDGSPPSGATIDPFTGIFNWTPDNAYLDTTNTITIAVSDDGSPPLSDLKSFQVAVVSPPRFESITLSNTIVTMTWTAINGQAYRVQYKNEIEDSVWTDLTPDVTATGPTATRDDSILSSTRRYYRVLVLP